MPGPVPGISQLIFYSQHKGGTSVKKTIWFILPILIIAVVLVAVFVGQRNSLSDQLVTMESEKQELTRQLTEADMAARTAQELAENDIAAARQEAAEAAEALTAVTTQRDALQAKSDAAAAQLNNSIRQAQQALDALVGEEASPEKELAKVKEEAAAALADANAKTAAVQAELDAVRAEWNAYQEAAAAAAEENKAQLESALANAEENKAQLESALAAAEEAKAELAALQESTAAQIEAAVAAALTDVQNGKTAVSITDAEGHTAAELDSLSDLAQARLPAGEYILTLILLDSEGGEIARYQLHYVVPAAVEEAAPEAPSAEETAPPEVQEALEATAEEGAKETPAAETEEGAKAPADGEAEETPVPQDEAA